MNRLRWNLLPLIVAVVVVHAATAQSVIPTPEFANEHVIPTSVTPDASATVWEYVDLAFLAVGLAAASVLALVFRSRRGLFVLSIVSLLWLGFWRQGCVCSIGAIQNVALAAVDPRCVVPWAVVGFFALPLVCTLFFGRTFCAAVCPLGAIQELVAVRPVKVPFWLQHTLGLLAFIYLGLAVIVAALSTADMPSRLICRFDPFVGFFRLSGDASMLILGGAFLLVGIFVGRPYCRFLCPYGALLGLLSRVSRWHVRIPPDECIQCRLCEDACPYGAIREPTVAQSTLQRLRGRRRLGALLLLLPILVGLGGWLGSQVAPTLARIDPTVRLADRVLAEETGQVEGTTDASDAFRHSGQSIDDLYGEARARVARYAYAGGSPGSWLRLSWGQRLATIGGGTWLGMWVGLVFGVKLVHLSVRRRRTDYRPDPAACVSCGRCFWYCPGEQARRGWIDSIPVNET